MGSIITKTNNIHCDNIAEIKENLDNMSIEELFKEIELALKTKPHKYDGQDFFTKKLFNKISLLNRSLTPKRITAWVFAPEFFRELLIPNFKELINNVRIQIFIIASGKSNTTITKYSSFHLKEDDGFIHIYDEITNFHSSNILACHVANGRETPEGYKYVYFITQSGSIYYGDGKTVDKESQKLMDKLLIISTSFNDTLKWKYLITSEWMNPST
jgi:hypothetical protein